MRIHWITQFFASFLDIILPKTRLVKELERMSARDFISRARRSEERIGKEITSIFDYRDPLVRRAIWELKYRGNQKISKILGKILHDELITYLEEYAPLTDFSNPLLIPIPISSRRRRERGFNQCEILLFAVKDTDIAKNFSIELKALIKIKDTPSQTHIENRQERMKNLKDCFAIADKKLIAGRDIILIDDVATTGATTEEAKKTLLKSGARKAIIFTLAH